jgi:hypothetical protein
MRELRYYVFISGLAEYGIECHTSMNSPRSAASEACGSLVVIEMLLFGSALATDLTAFFSFELLCACLFCLGLGFSTGAARTLRTGSLRQSRNVS